MAIIESAQNDRFRRYLGLTTAKGLKREGLFLLSGESLIREFLKTRPLKIHAEIVTAKLTRITDAESIPLAPDLFEQIDSIGTHFNILVLEQPAMATIDALALKKREPDGIELIAPIGDPGNLGALIRSAEAFGVTRVILTREAAHPFLPKAVKASAGSVLRMPLMRGPRLADCPENCIALAMDGISIHDFRWPDNGFLVVGEEGKGLGDAMFRQRITIPTQTVESLNAVVAASIALAFWKQQGKRKTFAPES